ncbi:dGTP triphosphohydrolase [Leekyejoonella antrihumi]|uniref:DNTP triphosphohydrolase n=1 Tax=Leekyejoonella antrihumi TaxID=1660198 RepID=A0A563DW25_9MICO|nr:dNTP triphosphohydrolase [Leekyejoonella antrihumi]TWP34417.1 dNTP triphosphohydrolase [Leekyejoonella antrihumi]
MLAEPYWRPRPKDNEPWRSPCERDCDAILYSSAWRRLRGVTQVTSRTDSLSKSHDRLLHSLKVAQVGERLAKYLLSEHPDLEGTIFPKAIRFAGLAHDLGHPPFGHVAEKELQGILANESYRYRLDDSFEGNAQTFRILTRLSHKASDAAYVSAGRQIGINATAVSIAATIKYPWEFHRAEDYLGDHYKRHLTKYYSKKWGFYGDDAALWNDIKPRAIGDGRTRSLNADIMDLADDVTYAIHDVHDYFRAGLIPLNAIHDGLQGSQTGIGSEFSLFDAYAISALDDKPEVGYTADHLMGAKAWLDQLPLPLRPYSDSDSDREALHAFESAAVRGVQENVSINGNGELYTPPEILLALEYLKELTWFYVINHPVLSSNQQGQRKIVRELHEWLCDWAMECYPEDARGNRQRLRRNLRRLPSRFRDLLWDVASGSPDDDVQVARAAVDFIAGLTDIEAASLHSKLGGSVLLHS